MKTPEPGKPAGYRLIRTPRCCATCKHWGVLNFVRVCTLYLVRRWGSVFETPANGFCRWHGCSDEVKRLRDRKRKEEK